MNGMWDMIRSLPEQLRWAAEQPLPQVQAAPEVLVAGMGGSAIAGDYAAPLAQDAGVRVVTHRSYGLPGWATGSGALVVGVSYSGNTEETLSAVETARELRLPVAVVACGGTLGSWAQDEEVPWVAVPEGLQPRAALGFLLGALLRLIEAATNLGATKEPLLEAAEVAEGMLAGPALRLAEDLAEGLTGRMVVVYGSEGATAAVARRWKTQINENAKAPAFWGLLPEIDHNELTGWEALSGLTSRSVGVVMLRDRAEDPRLEARFRLTRESISGRVPVVGEAHASGEGVLARMVSLTVVGDALSVLLAERAGVDPIPVAAIEELKAALRGGR